MARWWPVRRTWWGGAIAVVVAVVLLAVVWSRWIGADELTDTVAEHSTVLEAEARRLIAEGPDSTVAAPSDMPHGLGTAVTGGELGTALRTLGITRRFRTGSDAVFTKPDMGRDGLGSLVYAPGGRAAQVSNDCGSGGSARGPETRHLAGDWYAELENECDPFSSQTEQVFIQHLFGWILFVPVAYATAVMAIAAYRWFTAPNIPSGTS